MKSFAIIGLGLFGKHLAKELYKDGHTVLAIDSNEKLVEQIADDVTRAVTVDAKNRDALYQLGINKYDCVVVALSSDLATSVLVTMNLKALQVPQIVCKVQNEQDKEVLETLGATMCITPEKIAATKLSKKLTGRNVIDFTQLSENHSIIEISTPETWIGKSVLELNVRASYGVNIIGIRRDGNIKVSFDPAAPLVRSDELIIIGNNKNLDKIQKVR